MAQRNQDHSLNKKSRHRLMPTTNLTLEPIPTSLLTLHNRAVRHHPEDQISRIMASITTFGMINPIIIDIDNKVVAGEARLEAARRLELAEVQVIKVGHLTAAQARAYRLADNKTADGAVWDPDAFRDEVIAALQQDIDLEALGVTGPEYDRMLALPGEIDASDALIEPRRNPFVRKDDIFDLPSRAGAHTLMCGDSTDVSSVALLMGGVLADMTIADTPYNLRIAGNVSKRTGARAPKEFAQASGEMSHQEFSEFLRTVITRITDVSRPGAVIELFIDWRNIHRLIAAGEDCGLDYLNLAVWAKTAAGLGSFLRSQHELIAIFAKPGASPQNNVMLGANGRSRTNLWTYPSMAGFGRKRREDLDRHPTPKPIALIADAILDCSSRGDIILDLFGGGGTILIACERVGRVARAMEIDPGYVEASLVRYRTAFGVEPVHRQTGLTLNELEAQRRVEVSTVDRPCKMLALPSPDAFANEAEA